MEQKEQVLVMAKVALTRHRGAPTEPRRKYGGETDSDDSGNAGQMGSGSFASAGWTHAAYQGTIYYINFALTSQGTNCSANQTDSSCYAIDVHNSISSSWATYVFFGGPQCPKPSKSGAAESSRSSLLQRGWQHGRGASVASH